jgi:diguanylate cyclase (GGDEF)-like protein/PAS domain S-box-containing protein
MHMGRWQHIAAVYQRQGMLPGDVDRLLHGFLYRADAPGGTSGWSSTQAWTLLALLLLLTGVGVVAEYVRRVNTRLRAAMLNLSKSEERHRLLADNASDVIWVMDQQGRFTYVSPSVQRIRGYTVEEALGQTLEQALTPTSAAMARQAFEESVACLKQGKTPPTFRGELEQPCKDGSTIWTELSFSGMFNAEGQCIGFLGVSRDITERRRVQLKMVHMAQYDQLTQLPNRALLLDRVEQGMVRLRRSQGHHLALMFVDLDNFKPVNDQYGHAVGDRLLQAVAQRMTSCVRATDTVARVGGDEFVVLLPEVHGAAEAMAVGENIRLALERTFEVSSPDANGNGPLALHISSSLGVALFPDHGQGLGELIRMADEAMYRAKQGGRNRVQLASKLEESAPA